MRGSCLEDVAADLDLCRASSEFLGLEGDGQAEGDSGSTGWSTGPRPVCPRLRRAQAARGSSAVVLPATVQVEPGQDGRWPDHPVREPRLSRERAEEKSSLVLIGGLSPNNLILINRRTGFRLSTFCGR